MSEYYPELFERRKRSARDHEEWGKIKSMILLELMKGPETRSGLKFKLNEKLKEEGGLPISIKTIVRHLRDPNKKGLIDRKIVRERKGLLELPLSNPEEIAKFIDELSRNKTVGPKVTYFIDRVFAEAFLSPFGGQIYQ
jgi:DNA-binding HxlR family transcriptional regulator